MVIEVNHDFSAAFGVLPDLDFGAQCDPSSCSRTRPARCGFAAVSVASAPPPLATVRRPPGVPFEPVARSSRTLQPCSRICSQNSICSGSSPSGNRARAWPAEMSPVDAIGDRAWAIPAAASGWRSSSGRSSDACASSSWVQSCWSRVLLERQRLFDRVQVLPLQVLDNRQLGHQPVVGLADLGRHLGPAGLDRGPQPPLAGDQLIPVVDLPDQDRLQHAVFLEALGQRRDLGLVEIASRLERIVVDFVDIQPEQAVVGLPVSCSIAAVSAGVRAWNTCLGGRVHRSVSDWPYPRQRCLAGRQPRPKRRSLVTFEYLHAEFDIGSVPASPRGVVESPTGRGWALRRPPRRAGSRCRRRSRRRNRGLPFPLRGSVPAMVVHRQHDPAELQPPGRVLHHLGG